MRSDCVIIGGGLSGLSAAVELSSGGRSVVLLESAPKLGGRCYSYVDRRTGDVVDNGQHVLLGAYHHLFRYLETIGTRSLVRFQPNLELPLHHPEKGTTSFRIPGIPKPLHLTAGVLRFRVLTVRDRKRLMKIGYSLWNWDEHLENKLRHITVAEWLAGEGQSVEALRSFWHPLALSVMNEVPERACAFLFARALRTAFFGKSKDASMVFPAAGQSDLYVGGAESLLQSRGVIIRKSTEVTSLIADVHGVTGVRCADGSEVMASSVLSTVPPWSLGKLIPDRWKQCAPFSDIRLFEPSPIISIHLWFDGKVTDDIFTGVIGKNLQWIFNRRRIFGEQDDSAYLTCVISAGRGLAGMTKEQLIALAVHDVHAVYPASMKQRLIHSVVIKEKRATFSPTCEVELIRPAAQTPIPGFFLAGDWTRTGYPATIEGAVLSGVTATAGVNRFLAGR